MEKVTKVLILGLMLFFGMGTIYAQTDGGNNTPITEEEEFEMPDELPMYPGGIDGLMGFLSSHVHYPAEAVKDSIEGRVLVRFIVERDGSISNIEIAKHAHPLLDAEAIGVIHQMPKWDPGIKDGKPLRCRFTLPITFRIPRE